MPDKQTSDDNQHFLFCYLLNEDGRGTAVDSQTVNRWRPEDGSLWLHFDISNRRSRQWLEQNSGVPAQAIDILLAEETRPRTLAIDNGLLIVLRGVNTNPGANPEDMVSVRVWMEPHRIISTRRRRLLSVVDIAAALDTGDGPGSPSAFLAMLIDRLADRIGEFVDSIEGHLDIIEDEIGVANPSAIRSKLSPLRRQMASVRRFLAPQRDALDRMNRRQSPVFKDEDAMALMQEADRVTRYLEDLDLARERVVVLQPR